jgi:hypothetical protein
MNSALGGSFPPHAGDWDWSTCVRLPGRWVREVTSCLEPQVRGRDAGVEGQERQDTHQVIFSPIQAHGGECGPPPTLSAPSPLARGGAAVGAGREVVIRGRVWGENSKSRESGGQCWEDTHLGLSGVIIWKGIWVRHPPTPARLLDR